MLPSPGGSDTSATATDGDHRSASSAITDLHRGGRGGKLGAMGSPTDRQISDPLLGPDGIQRDARGAPVRAPLGNSIKTLIVFAVLIVIGVVIWWIRRPDDLTDQLGGREWVIVEVDGEPATNRIGTASTFVLDGNGEIRAVLDCNVATGSWRYDAESGRLVIDWQRQTQMACPGDWPQTFLPESGDVRLDGGVLRVTSDATKVRSIAPVDHDPAPPEEVAGVWLSGEQAIEIGRRGLFQVGACRGSWTPTEDDLLMEVTFDDVQPDACDLGPQWQDETPFVATIDGDALYLRRDRVIFPLDRAIIRLDPVE
jgi:hypothetical protein